MKWSKVKKVSSTRKESKIAVQVRIGSGQALASHLQAEERELPGNMKNEQLRDEEIKFYLKWEPHRVRALRSAKKQREQVVVGYSTSTSQLV